MNSKQTASLKIDPRKNPDMFAELLRQALTVGRVVEVVTQTAHGFSVADWVYHGSGSWALADRDAASSLADGVVSRVIGVNEFEVSYGGIVGSFTSLVKGDTYYLSSTAGAMTNTEPATGIIQMLGKAVSATQLRIDIRRTDEPINNLTIKNDLTVQNDLTVSSTGDIWDLIVSGDLRVDGDVGFFGTTPIAQQTGGSNITNNVTSGGTNFQIDDYTISDYSSNAATIRNNLYQLARSQKLAFDALRAYGLLD